MKDYKRKLQLKMLNIVKEIDRVYKLYNIDYYLIYGLASGVVRYQWFIPWNDDFDIGMTYKNYNMFIKVCDKELNKNEFETKRNEFLKISFKDNFTVVNKGKLYINEKANSKLIKIQINKGTYKRLLLDDALE